MTPHVRRGHAGWYRALSLAERLPGPAGSRAPHDHALLNRWRRQAAFVSPDLFEERLRADELSETEFSALLAESGDELASRVKSPEWLAALESAFDPERPATPSVDELSESVSDGYTRGCLRIIAPLLEAPLVRLKQGLRAPGASTDPGDEISTRDVIYAGWVEHLCDLVGQPLFRTLALEVNASRLGGELSGDSGEARFADFIARESARSGPEAILARYPVLARHLQTILEHWAEFGLLFVRHFSDASAALRGVLGEDPGRLRSLRAGAGDRHCRGRSVVELRFEGGRKVIYKPRALAIDVHFQQLLEWFNARARTSGTAELKILRVIDRGDHGWCEFVEYAPCPSPVAVRRFYEQHGALLAILYALGASDIHSENIIAAADQPVVVDLETLFHPDTIAPGVFDPALAAASKSVLSTLLLPQRWEATPGESGYDGSGLGDRPGQYLPGRPAVMAQIGTDEMHVEYRRVARSEQTNRPTLHGEPVDLAAYVAELCAGFSAAYELLALNRAELSELVARFADDPVRLIARDTNLYVKILQASFHPDFLRDGLERERIFDRLWLAVRDMPDLARFIASERADLHAGDVPTFWLNPGGRAIFDAAGRRLRGELEISGLDAARRRIAELGAQDRDRQLWFIRASLAASSIAEEGACWPSPAAASSSGACTRDRLLSHARVIGSRIVEQGLGGGDGLGWLGLSSLDERAWTVDAVGPDLYNGLGGIALFLAHLGAVSGEDRFQLAARAALATLRRYLAPSSSPAAGIGAFSDLAAPVYLLAHVGRLWNEPALLDEAEARANVLTSAIGKNSEPNVARGAAGCVAALLSLYAARPSRATLAAAVQCRDPMLSHLRALRTPGTHGFDDTSALSFRAGFTRGTPGIAHGLGRLAAVTGDSEARALAIEALALEPEYADERASPHPSVARSWCQGVLGGGIARAAALLREDDPRLHRQLSHLVRTIATRPFGANHSLCHGDLGTLEFLWAAAHATNDRHAHSAFAERLPGVLDDIDRRGYISGAPRGVETPGLLAGLAGIGYGLLRFAEPDRVPCVLTLDGPAP